MTASIDQFRAALPNCLSAELREAAALAFQHAPYLRGLMRRAPEWLSQIGRSGLDAFIAESIEAARSAKDDIAVELRRARARNALGVALGDLGGMLDLTAVTCALSDFAEAALDRAIRAAFEERVSEAKSDGFAAIALGKLGSRELNYSSDIDLIFLYDGDRMLRRPDDEPESAAVRIARRVSELLQRPGSEGHVARVDLRLRPDAEVNPVAIPFRRAEIYYQSEALTWERAAFIRARAVAGDIAAGEAFLNSLQPFVWRRSLDYTAIRDIEDMSLSIREHYEGERPFGPGYDLKRGRGGIREIEFFAQTHQLIFGGRNPQLREPGTRAALDALARTGHVNAKTVGFLSAAYTDFRNAEHRLQMREDAQTHEIPAAADAREAFAALAGAKSYRALESDFRRKVGKVAAIYDELTADNPLPPVPRGEELAAYLKEAGAEPVPDYVRMIENWRTRPHRALRSDTAQREFENALPTIIAAFSVQSSGARALRRFDDFLARLPSGIRLFALIEANPKIAETFARVLGLAPLLARKLARRAELLDALIDPLPAGDRNAELAALARTTRDYEAMLDAVRRWAGEQRFRIGVAIMEDRIDPLVAAREYAEVADAALRLLASEAQKKFADDHGRVPGGALLVLAFGRYGGAALTESSDLDLVFLFSGDHDAVSDGEKTLPATTYFNRLAQRLVGALTVQTAAGPLYEVDTRLRPSGTQGLLAVSTATFDRYQREEAWTWEHMALTRARLVVGDAYQDEIEATIYAALRKNRDADRLLSEVKEMRAEMMAAHPEQGPMDVKRGRGGLIDLEFIVHHRQLASHRGFNPDLREAIKALIEAGDLDSSLLDAHDLMTRYLVISRLMGEALDTTADAPARARAAQCCDVESWTELKKRVGRARKHIGAAWKREFEGQEHGEEA